MNILPKKRWHVRTKDNIARVRRDEAQAADEEKEIIRRAKLAEQESRTTLLRLRANGTNDNLTKEEKVFDDEKEDFNASKTTADIYTSEGNINFFKELETGHGMCNGSTNKEHEQEEKDEKEKYEKKIGLLTYLGQDTIEATKSKEWYHDNSKSVSSLWSKNNDTLTASQTNSNEVDTGEVGLKFKKRLDPLNDIIKYTSHKKPSSSLPSKAVVIDAPVELNFPSEKKIKKLRKMLKEKVNKQESKISKRKSHSTERKSKRRRHQSSSDDSEIERKSKRKSKRKNNESIDDIGSKIERKKYKKCKINKHSKRDRKLRRKSSSSSNSNSSLTTDSENEREVKKEQKNKIDKLRQERLAREASERKRTQLFLSGSDKTEEKSNNTTYQKYSSQFNPTLARQNKSNSGLQKGVNYF